MQTRGMPGLFDVPPGTVFKDLSGLTDDEVAAHVSLDVRDLPPEQLEALKETIADLAGLNAWLDSL
jgi:hypothetical protein